MRLFLAMLLALACLPAPAEAGALTRPPVEDLGLPFWCDWGYDWDERCYTDNTARLPVGGVDGKVWRAALRFSLDALPPAAAVTAASLQLYNDGLCVAPRRRVGPCLAADYTIDAHRILSASWTKEREVEFDPEIVSESVVETASADWYAWDVTSLVRAWADGAQANHGLLLKLMDGEEDFGVSGPYFPSASFPTAALRPRLLVAYTVPTTGLSP